MSDLGWILERLPNQVFNAMGAASGLAFLAGPMALLILVPGRRAGGLHQHHARLPAAMLLSLLSVTAPLVTGTASLVLVFRRIAETGSGGAGAVAHAGIAAAEPVLYGVVTLATCLVGVAALTLRRGSSGHPDSTRERAPMSPGLAVGLSALLVLAMVVVDRLLRLHHGLMNGILTVIDPARRGNAIAAGVGGSGFAAVAEHNSSVLILGGGLLTLVLLVAGLAIWRASRARRRHPLLVWTSTVALVVVLVGAAWHARLLSAGLASYRDVTGRTPAAVSPRL